MSDASKERDREGPHACQAARHYDEQALALLVLRVALVNVWSRVNVTTRQVAGAQSW